MYMIQIHTSAEMEIAISSHTCRGPREKQLKLFSYVFKIFNNAHFHISPLRAHDFMSHKKNH